MKIALITRRYPPLIGGAEKVLSYLAPALAAEGAEVTVLTARPAGLDLPETETHAPPGGKGPGTLRIERLGTSRLRFLGTWLYMQNLRRRLARERFDVIYASMLKHDAYVAVGEAKRQGVPVVLRPEGAGATGDVAWQGWGRFGRTIAARCRQADAFVSIAAAVTDELTRAGYDAAKVVALPNGVPIPEPSWQRRPGWREAPHVAYLGRLAPEKGLDTLVDAWPDVLAAFPKARLTIAGDGPLRPRLDAAIRRLDLAGSIELPGAVDDPNTLLRGADLFVLPSREEGMSIALLEAMALGIPLVATAIPGNRRLIQDFKHGRLVAPDDPSALARTILDQLNGFDRAYHMTRAARRRVQDEFSIQAVARRHLELFEKLIAARASA